MRKDIVNEALTWLETPYHHKAMVKFAGVDCAMLVAGIAYELGIISRDLVLPDYSVQWHLHNNEEKLLDVLNSVGCKQRKDKNKAEPGDILTFQYGRVSSHLGVLINNNQIIHARLDIGKVVINDLDEDLLKRWTYTYKFPGVK